MPETHPVRVVCPFVERWTETAEDGRVLGPFTHRGEEIVIEQRPRARTRFSAKLLRAKARYASQPLNDVQVPPARRVAYSRDQLIRQGLELEVIAARMRAAFDWPSAGNS